MTPVRQEVRKAMGVLVALRVQRRNRLGGSSGRRYPKKRGAVERREYNIAGRAPCSSQIHRGVADIHGRPAGERNFLQFAFREKSDELFIRRPKRVPCPFSSGQ